MKITDKLVEILKSDTGHVYVYVAKDSKNLDAVRAAAMESCDLSKATAKVVLVHPIGLTKITLPVRGIYIDKESTTEDHVRKYLNTQEYTTIEWVNPETLEIES